MPILKHSVVWRKARSKSTKEFKRAANSLGLETGHRDTSRREVEFSGLIYLTIRP